MRIKKQDLVARARNLVAALDREGVDSDEKVDDYCNKNVSVEAQGGEYIEFEMRHVGVTPSRTVSYRYADNCITPIQLRIRPDSRISQIIVLCDETLTGYEGFSGDFFGNVAQNKVFAPGSFPEIRAELERLAGGAD